MKYLKMLGLAAVSAMAFMAIVGASSASATVACTATTTPECTGTDMYGATTVLHSSLKTGTSAKLTGSGGEVIATCTGSTVKGDQENTGSSTETIGILVTELLWSGCNQTTDTVNPGTLELHWISGTHNATVTAKNAEVTVNIFGVSCTYGSGATGLDIGTLIGGTAPELNIAANVTKTAGGFLCPGTAGWDAEYIVTEPHAVFFTTN